MAEAGGQEQPATAAWAALATELVGRISADLHNDDLEAMRQVCLQWSKGISDATPAVCVTLLPTSCDPEGKCGCETPGMWGLHNHPAPSTAAPVLLEPAGAAAGDRHEGMAGGNEEAMLDAMDRNSNSQLDHDSGSSLAEQHGHGDGDAARPSAGNGPCPHTIRAPHHHLPSVCPLAPRAARSDHADVTWPEGAAGPCTHMAARVRQAFPSAVRLTVRVGAGTWPLRATPSALCSAQQEAGRQHAASIGRSAAGSRLLSCAGMSAAAGSRMQSGGGGAAGAMAAAAVGCLLSGGDSAPLSRDRKQQQQQQASTQEDEMRDAAVQKDALEGLRLLLHSDLQSATVVGDLPWDLLAGAPDGETEPQHLPPASLRATGDGQLLASGGDRKSDEWRSESHVEWGRSKDLGGGPGMELTMGSGDDSHVQPMRVDEVGVHHGDGLPGQNGLSLVHGLNLVPGLNLVHMPSGASSPSKDGGSHETAGTLEREGSLCLLQASGSTAVASAHDHQSSTANPTHPGHKQPLQQHRFSPPGQAVLESGGSGDSGVSGDTCHNPAAPPKAVWHHHGARHQSSGHHLVPTTGEVSALQALVELPPKAPMQPHAGAGPGLGRATMWQAMLLPLQHLVELRLLGYEALPPPHMLASMQCLSALRTLDLRLAARVSTDKVGPLPPSRLSAFSQPPTHTPAHSTRVWDSHLEALGLLVHLTTLHLSGVTAVTAHGLSHLHALSHLRSLSLCDALDGRVILGSHVQALAAALPHLRCLTLGRTVPFPGSEGPGAPPNGPQSSSWGNALTHFKGLSYLGLQFVHCLDEQMLSVVSQLPGLRVLDLEGLDMSYGEVLVMLASVQRVPALRHLLLGGCVVYDAHLEAMATLTQLRQLSLNMVDVWTRDLSGWTCLAPLTALTRFEFQEWNNPVLSVGNLAVLTDESVSGMVANWHNLMQLRYLGKVQLTSRSRRSLASLPHLSQLHIIGPDGTCCIGSRVRLAAQPTSPPGAAGRLSGPPGPTTALATGTAARAGPAMRRLEGGVQANGRDADLDGSHGCGNGSNHGVGVVAETAAVAARKEDAWPVVDGTANAAMHCEQSGEEAGGPACGCLLCPHGAAAHAVRDVSASDSPQVRPGDQDSRPVTPVLLGDDGGASNGTNGCEETHDGASGGGSGSATAAVTGGELYGEMGAGGLVLRLLVPQSKLSSCNGAALSGTPSLDGSEGSEDSVNWEGEENEDNMAGSAEMAQPQPAAECGNLPRRVGAEDIAVNARVGGARARVSAHRQDVNSLRPPSPRAASGQPSRPITVSQRVVGGGAVGGSVHKRPREAVQDLPAQLLQMRTQRAAASLGTVQQQPASSATQAWEEERRHKR